MDSKMAQVSQISETGGDGDNNSGENSSINKILVFRYEK